MQDTELESEPAKRRVSLEQRLADGPPLLLDGATGTELERRGVASELPLWSARALLSAPEAVTEIHTAYVRAGAELLTANTFRTQRRNLARGGLAERAAELTQLAVALAREACVQARAAGVTHPIWIAGSAPPLEDCYRPERVPSPTELEREHAEHAENLARAGVDWILAETMNTAREAEAALHAARAVGVPAGVSFVCTPDARLLSGEPLTRALKYIVPLQPLVVLVNCSPPESVAACLPVLANSGCPFGVYANLSAPDPTSGHFDPHTYPPDVFAEYAESWLRSGAHIIGGCCGTTPAHIAALAELRARLSQQGASRGP